MKTTGFLFRHYCIAKQAGFMPASWSAISLGNDRTPELKPGSREGWDD
jgi:hypothetical protein